MHQRTKEEDMKAKKRFENKEILEVLEDNNNKRELEKEKEEMAKELVEDQMYQKEKLKKGLPKRVNESTHTLILGSFPSVKSRHEDNKTYYANPQNQFWKIMGDIFGKDLTSYEDKPSFLLEKHIGLWDVIDECYIDKSSDQSIRNVKLNDFKNLFKDFPNIKLVLLNGRKAEKEFEKLKLEQGIPDYVRSFYLPSTSSLNRMKNKLDLWKSNIIKA
jgi:hypoxanthine-DNA glycosylase